MWGFPVPHCGDGVSTEKFRLGTATAVARFSFLRPNSMQFVSTRNGSNRFNLGR